MRMLEGSAPDEFDEYICQGEPSQRARGYQEMLRQLAAGPLGVKELMERFGLKNRAHFLTRYISPALQDGLIEPIHPESPRHPRQKYRLRD